MSSKGCFCHFNGYEVKDAQARRDIGEIQGTLDIFDERIEVNKNIAEGRARSFVFDTYQDMFNALEEDDGTTYKLGDNLFIKALNVPDYWISEVLTDNSGEMGHYNVSMLETQKVDLTGYTPINDHNTLWDNVSDLETNLEELQEDKSKVVANPGLEGNETILSNIEIDGTKYGLPGKTLYYNSGVITYKATIDGILISLDFTYEVVTNISITKSINGVLRRLGRTSSNVVSKFCYFNKSYFYTDKLYIIKNLPFPTDYNQHNFIVFNTSTNTEETIQFTGGTFNNSNEVEL